MWGTYVAKCGQALFLGIYIVRLEAVTERVEFHARSGVYLSFCGLVVGARSVNRDRAGREDRRMVKEKDSECTEPEINRTAPVMIVIEMLQKKPDWISYSSTMVEALITTWDNQQNLWMRVSNSQPWQLNRDLK